MISLHRAHALAEAGLRWRPVSGDSFAIPGKDMDAARFTVSELTIEVHTYPTGTVLGFNGTTEWALDSVAVEDTLWLPREDQLRELLGETFVALTRDGTAYQVHTHDAVDGEARAYTAAAPADAYADALLHLLREAGAASTP
ncbi:pilus assembly protein CpaE [Serinibacter salmoneus]|uniref:Pilus assembly protein CpaE n=1 Tax=Serinibacter salmoneus TaxID=556530 RepID=A0A2A9D0M0_9MICO|nr:pilus assembly protein CpaE [Serinibacter salmoneus]PFG20237.1 hypothetical protein ATL40_1832 [Serinibacter salmoneus]